MTGSSKATSKRLESINSKNKTDQLDSTKQSIDKDVVRIVTGSFGNGEHYHEEFWVPCDPGNENDLLNRTKLI